MSDIMISYFSFDGEQHLNSIIGRKWFFSELSSFILEKNEINILKPKYPLTM